MKVLKDHVLLYDQLCPMCTAYSCAFVRAGVLEPDGRAAYQAMDAQTSASVNLARVPNEIALLNRKTGEVTYGAQSLMVILQHVLPFLAPLFRQGWFQWLAQRAYRFVSYNRRVMMPVRETSGIRPGFHVGYRTAYLAVCWLLTAAVLHRYSSLVVPLIPPTSYGREFFICGGQIAWQWFFLRLLHRGKAWDYLGNMMTISLAGAIALEVIMLLLPAGWSPYIYGVLFTGVAGLMFLEHIRRTRILGVSSWLTVTWVLYRILLLGVILWS